MKSLVLSLAAAIAFGCTGAAIAKSSDGGGPRAPSAHGHASHSRAVAGVGRDSRGRITRSQKAKDDFKRQHPCPATGKSRGACPGYVIDHVVPLKRGGTDRPSNMQWQTREAAREKDKTE